jgi:hypothetical protein
MDIMVHIPDDLARRLGTAGELERRALEALAAQEYRLGHLAAADLRRLLGFEAVAPLDSFLKAHGVHDGGEPRTSLPEALDDETRARARAAAERIITRGEGVTLGGLTIKDLINEGRK